MYRVSANPPATEHSAAPRDPIEAITVAFIGIVCSLRVVQGLMLEQRLGAGTSLAFLGLVWVIRSSMSARRLPRR